MATVAQLTAARDDVATAAERYRLHCVGVRPNQRGREWTEEAEELWAQYKAAVDAAREIEDTLAAAADERR